MNKLILMVLLSLNMLIANAHQSSTSFINLEQSVKQTSGLWKVSINALNTVISMDVNNDGYVKWDEVKQQKNSLVGLLNDNMEILSNSGDCSILSSKLKNLKLDSILNMNYIIIPFSTNCRLQDINRINYKFYFEYDSDHKAIMSLVGNKKTSSVHVFSADMQLIKPKVGSIDSFLSIVHEGVWHILIGFDHIVFLITLMIGILFIEKSKLANKKRSNIIEILKVVTAFTVAHSLTLGLAAFNLVSVSVQFIEAAIAITLVIAALHNIRSSLPSSLNYILSWSVWKMAFIFGLVHGFGFANVLTELQLSSSNIAMTLLAFNIGVELGQFLIVLLFVVLTMQFISKIQGNYKLLAAVRPISSGLVVLLGTVWFVERSFNIVVL